MWLQNAMTRIEAGLIWQWGALDFAGERRCSHQRWPLPAWLVLFMIGKRQGYGKEGVYPLVDHDHDRRLAAVGGLVRFQRRFCTLKPTAFAALAFMNTFLATAAAVTRLVL